jgi:glycerophosphoryl diester phosphodiesterase
MTRGKPGTGDRHAVRVIAHRGASRDCPENTLAAFEEALRQGADGIELDVQLARDGVPVVYHDRTLVRAGGGRRGVARLTLDELAALDAGSWFDERFRGQPIPALEEVLVRFGRRTTLLLELKARGGRRAAGRHAELARSAATLVRGTNAGASVIFLCFDFDVLETCAEHAPEVRRALNLKPPRRLRGALAGRLQTLHALSADVRSLTPEFGRAVAEAGRELLVYTCNTERSVRAALAAGATGMMSDRPGWLSGRLRGTAGADAP